MIDKTNSMTEIKETSNVCHVTITYHTLLSLLKSLPLETKATALGILQKQQDPEFTTKAEYALFEACRDVAVEQVS